MSAATPSTPPASIPDTLRVKVNGIAVEAPRTMPDPVTGRPVPTTMMQACELAGVVVPHYCYHPKLPVAGNCRMCLVEFALPALGPDRQPLLNEDGTPRVILQMLPYEPGTPRGAIACATPLCPGMEIYTDTPSVRQMRQAVLESLLINHPLDCPICDQAGECQLQQYTLDHGGAASRFVEHKVHKPKQVDLGPRIMLDDERCILCSRCIRFTRDIVGDDALGIVNRGSYSTLTHYPGQPFDNNYTLNTVDLCPVGALTSKDFRFQMRVWFLKETPSLCTSCGTGCNIVIGSRENRIYRFTPRQNDAVNACWMCDAGRLNYRWIGRADRLTRPERLGPGGIREVVTWAAAVRETVERLNALSPGAVAVVASARQTTEELHLLKKIADRLRATTASVPRLGPSDPLLVHPDKNPNSNGARLTGICGADLGSGLAPIAEGIRTGAIRALVVFGEDVTKHGIGVDLLDRLEFLWVSDVLPNATTARAHLLLPGAAAAEKRGTFINAKGRLQRFQKALDPPGEARPETEFLADVWAAWTGEPAVRDPETLMERMAADVPALRGQTWAGLGDQGVVVPV